MNGIPKWGKITIATLIVLVVLITISTLLENVGFPRVVTSGFIGLFLGLSISAATISIIDMFKNKDNKDVHNI